MAPVLREHRRFMVLHLPRWATDCLKRADPALAASSRPLVLWEKQKGAMRIVALDRESSSQGLFAGQTLSDARALVPNLEAREIDRDIIERIFTDFADWHSNASPIVSVLTDVVPYGDLCLDITGVSHLFSGETAMLSQLAGRLTTLGFTVTGAIASTVGAAWALTRFSPGTILDEGNEQTALQHLPVAGLRLDETQITGLTVLGLKCIGQLYGRNRKDLQSRFGLTLLMRLDQAFGWLEERPTPRLPLSEYYVERRFAEPIGLMDDVLMCAKDLSIQLSYILEAKGIGAQAFHLFLYRVDHKVISLSVNAARATRDATHISRLFAYRAERLGGEYDAGFGIDMIRLAASETTEVGAVQNGAFGENDGAADLDHLYDRLTSRLGAPAVVHSKIVNTHIPDQVVKLEPVIARTDQEPDLPAVNVPRPLKLLPRPEPITVIAEVPDAPPASMVWRRIGYRFAKSSGPERIGAEWRNSDAKLVLTSETMDAANRATTGERYFLEGEATRDYYVAEDEGGRRFWIFRLGLFGIAESPRWFLHGFFG
jgi:protein ImuB